MHGTRAIFNDSMTLTVGPRAGLINKLRRTMDPDIVLVFQTHVTEISQSKYPTCMHVLMQILVVGKGRQQSILPRAGVPLSGNHGGSSK